MRGPRTTVRGPGTPVFTVRVKNVHQACLVADNMGWTVESVFLDSVRITAHITTLVPSVDRALSIFWTRYGG